MKKSILTIAFSLLVFNFNLSANNDDPKSLIKKVDVKRIVKVQRGVTNFQGKSGVYIYYVLPGSPNFSESWHKRFLTDSEAFDLKINSLNK